MKRELKRGDLYYANLDPVIGSEQGGTRPVLIIQNNVGNRFSPTTIVIAAVTSRTGKAKLPTHVPLSEMADLDKSSILLLEQLRTIDRNRLRGYVGTVDNVKMLEVDQALAVSLGIDIDVRKGGQKDE